MKKTLLFAAALSLLGAPLQSAMAQSSASGGAADIQLQGAPQPEPDSALANLRNGQVDTDTKRPDVGAQANVEAYPSDGSQNSTDREHQDAPSDQSHQDRNKDFPQ